MIERISICPFDLGFDLDEFSDLTLHEDTYELHCTHANTKSLSGKDWISIRCWSECDVWIQKSGFGVMVVRNSVDSELSAESTATALFQRREFHNSVISGQHSIASRIKTIRSALSKVKTKASRPLLWESSPYIFSFYTLQCDPSLVSEPSPLSSYIAALVEPSLVLAEDTPGQQFAFTEVALVERIEALDNNSITAHLKNYSISPTAGVYISWASMVVCSCEKSNCEKYVSELIELEIRLQTAWITTHYINCWKMTALDSPCPTLNADKLRWRLVKLDESTNALLDASISSRLKKIWECLVATSGYDDEKQKAIRGIRLVSEYAEFKRSIQEKGYRNIVEICLFLFAVSSVIPLFMSPPLVILPKWTLVPLFLLASILIGLRVWKSK